MLKAFKAHEGAFNIHPMPVKRDWMDESWEKHAYHCFPVTTANTIGWYLSSPRPVTFKWNGIIETKASAVEILDGTDFCHPHRGHGTVSFNTGIRFESSKNISLWTVNPMNYFNNDWEVLSSLISTSFYPNELPLAIRAKTPDKEITIDAGQPIATIVPISLSSLKEASVDIYDWDIDQEYTEKNKSYGEAAAKYNKVGEWTNWYRDAVDENGVSIGEHEVKALKLKVSNNSKRYKNE